MITPYSFGLDYNGNNRNVINKYKDWVNAEIRADLQKNRSECVNIFINLSGDFNKASAIRSHNAFLGKEVYIVGHRRYDIRGTVGTNHYETIYHADDLREVVDKLHAEGYTIFAVDNIEKYNPECIFDVQFPIKSAFLYGEEGDGLSKRSIQMCDRMIYIQQYGSVRSLNVASAASIVMYEYTRQYNQRNSYEKM